MMEPMQVAKQTVEFYKTSFTNSFNAMVMLQEQAQKMFDVQLQNLPGLPDEGKKVIKEWIGTYNKGCQEFKKAVDDGFQKVESYFSEAEKS